MRHGQRENYEKEIAAIKNKIQHYDTKLSSAAFDLDMGVYTGKADVRYYGRKITDLYKELDQIEITHHRHYSTSEISKMEIEMANKDAKLHSMMHDEEKFGVSYTNRIAVQQFDIDSLKAQLDKAKHFKDK